MPIINFLHVLIQKHGNWQYLTITKLLLLFLNTKLMTVSMAWLYQCYWLSFVSTLSLSLSLSVIIKVKCMILLVILTDVTLKLHSDPQRFQQPSPAKPSNAWTLSRLLPERPHAWTLHTGWRESLVTTGTPEQWHETNSQTAILINLFFFFFLLI